MEGGVSLKFDFSDALDFVFEDDPTDLDYLDIPVIEKKEEEEEFIPSSPPPSPRKRGKKRMSRSQKLLKKRAKIVKGWGSLSADEKARRLTRMENNRQSAERSRERKKRELEELVRENKRLKNRVDALEKKLKIKK